MLGHFGVDLGQELPELDRSMPTMNAGDHSAVGGVERGEQTGGAVPDVVVSAFLRHARHHRERRLRPGEGLDLALLIHTEHHGSLGWVQIQADDVVDLVHELRVVGKLELVLTMRLQFERLPDPSDRGLGQAGAFGHLRPRPVRGILRRGLQRRHHHVLDLLRGDHRRSARARLIDQAIQPGLQEPGPPLANRVRRAAHPLGHRLVVQAFAAAKHDPGA